MEKIIEIKNLNINYGLNKAIKNVTMDIYKNEILAFIGPSGCGKSTLLRTLNRMNDLIENCVINGEINFKNENIYKVENINLLRKKIGMVFQRPNPFPMSIYENIVYGVKLHYNKTKKELDEIVKSTLQDVNLWEEVKDKLHINANSLSGGQQQRLCIARCLAICPELILMDEPTSALDPISTLKIEELILKLKEKYTIVIVTHNMQQAMRISDRTAFFLMGDLIEIDNTNKIFKYANDERTRKYINGQFG